MYPFWDFAIMPALRAANARRIVEIGALRGETTVKMIKELGPDTELHVIDPVPEFDPTVHEREFPGQYVFHRDLSLNVLGSLPAMDAALVDGDHNWYTVFNELRLLHEVTEAAGRPLPLLLLHDVGWPYGRRDLYYDPSNIPPEHQRPHRRAGINLRNNKLVDVGGFNKTLHNAEAYGGPENGVMTGLEDFLETFDRPYRHVMLPIYYGLSVVAETALLAQQPELAAFLDRLEAADGKDEIIGLSERIRLEAAGLEQAYLGEFMRRSDVLAERYLRLTKAAIVGDANADLMMRVAALDDASGVAPVVAEHNDPTRADRTASARLAAARRHGSALGPKDEWLLSSVGRDGLDQIHAWVDQTVDEHVAGDLVELGAGRGGVGVFLAAHRSARFRTDVEVVVFDSFSSASPGDLNTVRDAYAAFGVLDEGVRFRVGEPPVAMAEEGLGTVSFCWIDPDALDDAAAAFDALRPYLSDGARVAIHAPTGDIADELAALAGSSTIEQPVPNVVGWRHATAPATTLTAPPSVPATGSRVPHPVSSAASATLSVVVVAYDMRRELARTLRSLSRTYQQGIDDLDYEVLVVENGSPVGGAVTADDVAGFGPEFRLIEMGNAASSSPTAALNAGLAAARGEFIACMIDGAHLLSPGVLRHALDGLRLHAPAIVATQGFFLGPGQQGETMTAGYDQASEDRLFEAIEWPTDGYRLFDIAHFQEHRDWFDGMWESNCLFAPRELFAQLGGFDDGFDEPGGGYANLEIFERFGNHPGVTVVSLLGEASFHQIHGGTTNNEPSPEHRFGLLEQYRNRYAELRGRPWDGPRKPLHFVGSMHPGARRTKARRLRPDRRYFREAAVAIDSFVPPPQTPMPDDLRDAHLEALWLSRGWEDTAWLGHRSPTTPDDLLTHARLVEQSRPTWIVDLSNGEIGRSVFLANLCEQLGHGTVLAVTPEEVDDPQVARWKSVVVPAPTAEDALAPVLSIVPAGSAMLILGGPRPRAQIMELFESLHELVAVDSHAVLEWTVVNGNPIWPEHGGGAREAIRDLRDRHPDFVVDRTVESVGPSFNRGGHLKRVR